MPNLETLLKDIEDLENQLDEALSLVNEADEIIEDISHVNRDLQALAATLNEDLERERKQKILYRNIMWVSIGVAATAISGLVIVMIAK